MQVAENLVYARISAIIVKYSQGRPSRLKSGGAEQDFETLRFPSFLVLEFFSNYLPTISK